MTLLVRLTKDDTSKHVGEVFTKSKGANSKLTLQGRLIEKGDSIVVTVYSEQDVVIKEQKD